MILCFMYNGDCYEFISFIVMFKVVGFLWNQKMMVQIICCGYVIVQFMQLELVKYVYVLNFEVKIFMQLELNYYVYYLGCFVYIKDEELGYFFFVFYEFVCIVLD